MSDEKMREEFEAFWNAPEQEELRMSCAKGWAFEVWKASRAALVIELPRLPNLNEVNDIGQCAASRNMHYACRRAIEAAGVRVKQ